MKKIIVQPMTLQLNFLLDKNLSLIFLKQVSLFFENAVHFLCNLLKNRFRTNKKYVQFCTSKKCSIFYDYNDARIRTDKHFLLKKVLSTGNFLDKYHQYVNNLSDLISCKISLFSTFTCSNFFWFSFHREIRKFLWNSRFPGLYGLRS